MTTNPFEARPPARTQSVPTETVIQEESFPERYSSTESYSSSSNPSSPNTLEQFKVDQFKSIREKLIRELLQKRDDLQASTDEQIRLLQEYFDAESKIIAEQLEVVGFRK